MRVHNANLDAYVECKPDRLAGLIELAERVDKFVGAVSPPDGYDLATATAAILNGGSAEEIQAGLTILAGWNFQPEGGWPHAREETT